MTRFPGHKRGALRAALFVLPVVVGCDGGDLTGGAAIPRGRIPPEGGALCLQGVCIEAPSGAVPATAEITVQTVRGDAGVPAVGPVYDLRVSGEGFDAPVTLRLPLPTGRDANSVTVYMAPEAAGPWFPVPARASGDGRGIELATNHFSLWALVPNGAMGERVSDLAYDGAGRLYALEPERGRVARYDDGRLTSPQVITSIGGASLTGADRIALDARGRLYVLSTPLHGVWRTDDAPGSAPVFGDLGSASRFYSPGLALGADGAVFALTGARVLRVADLAGASPTEYVGGRSRCRSVTVPANFGRQGQPARAGCMRFSMPDHLAIDGRGRVYVSDRDLAVVARMDDLSGAGWTTYAEPVSAGSEWAHSPVAVGFDARQRPVIAYLHFVVRLEDLSGAGRTVLWRGDEEVTAMAVGPRGELALALRRGTTTALRVDECPDDPDKLLRGFCGCGAREDPADADGDGVPDCADTSPAQACDCFDLAAVQRARAVPGARCVDGGPTRMRTTGVTRTENGGTFLVGAEARDGDYFCAAGCQSGCAAPTERPLHATVYEACANIARVGCGL